MTGATKPVLVAACGNVLAGDDAFGPLVLEALESLWPTDDPLRGEVDLLDLATAPASLLDALPGRFGLVLVDAVWVASEAEDLIDVPYNDPTKLPLLLQPPGSSHGMGLGWQLRLAAELRLLPEYARLLAVPIAGARVGELKSAGIAERVHQAVEAADRWCRAYVSLWREGRGGCSGGPVPSPAGATADALAADGGSR